MPMPRRAENQKVLPTPGCCPRRRRPHQARQALRDGQAQAGAAVAAGGGGIHLLEGLEQIALAGGVDADPVS
jgi:hypothetical protein